ncbi:MAG: cytochrome c peroxidase [Pseudomonadota bacterium]|jgi:cytochrome c peroxidase|uniref:Cytochrome c biogenesis protein CcsA n=2 Tax=Vreelandella aquamarina TaxID=77097 RepID=A0A1H8IQD8_9GAMM|nr:MULTISPECIES: cytochrome c peroxidase [Halomonas]MBV65438.1 cytochrome-c peroxidase [Halomonas sp.]MEC8938090.1 cytochrome c peroxidase [Pseudomonadota bacterium]MCP1302756.1 c-type cytochrome [Halomonas sp. R1t8]MCP1328741.1 c-type cytochrome [Halomonas sp. R1t4]MDK2752041.1 c-type cytochrome [Halomonas meridiana]|tara:strand:+ start:274 stop:1260 length:987 start_codon:yes stop_codon:yes gene_type:complete
MRNKYEVISALGATLLLSASAAQASDGLDEYRQRFEPLPHLPPLPATNSQTEEKVELGNMLFFEPRISSSGVISCATCHNPALGWSDRIPRAVGHNGQVGERNTPTVLNSGFLDAQFWDGREPDLEAQALGPIQADVEMAMQLEHALERLAEFERYQDKFSAAYPDQEDPINADNLGQALAAFQRTLNTPDAPFDRYLRGDMDAISEQAKNGMVAFVDNGCIACHRGANFTDSQFHAIQVPGSTDLGRYVVTGEERDKYRFRTPTLRNVGVTYPYMNNGATETLEEAVAIMGQEMLGREFDEPTIDNITAFLHSLTGEMPDFEVPALP